MQETKPIVVDIEQAKNEAKRLALAKIEQGEVADEFVEIGTVDGSKIYIAASFDPAGSEVHTNDRDCFLAIFEGSVELHYTRPGQTINVGPGQCTIVVKGAEHSAVFQEITVYLVVVGTDSE